VNLPDGMDRRAVAPLLAGVAGGLLLTALQVPAGTLLGAVLGSAVARPPAGLERSPLQTGVRVTGMVALGCVSAAGLNAHTLETMLRIAAPVVAGVAALLVLNVVLARWLVARHGLDATTAVLACAPGGFSELSVVAVKEGADVGAVAVVHLARVLVVVLLVVPVLVVVLSHLA
jgi:uncharacterized protein